MRCGGTASSLKPRSGLPPNFESKNSDISELTLCAGRHSKSTTNSKLAHFLLRHLRPCSKYNTSPMSSPSILDQRGQILPIRLESGPSSSAVSSVTHTDSSATETVPVTAGGGERLRGPWLALEFLGSQPMLDKRAHRCPTEVHQIPTAYRKPLVQTPHRGPSS